MTTSSGASSLTPSGLTLVLSPCSVLVSPSPPPVAQALSAAGAVASSPAAAAVCRTPLRVNVFIRRAPSWGFEGALADDENEGFQRNFQESEDSCQVAVPSLRRVYRHRQAWVPTCGYVV